MPTDPPTQLYESARELLAVARTFRHATHRVDHGPAVPAALACLDETLVVVGEASAALAEEMRRVHMLSERSATACMVALDGLTQALGAAREACGIAHGKAALASGAPTTAAL